MSPTRYHPNGLPLRAFEREKLTRLMHERGARRLCADAEINRGTLARALAGLGLYAPTAERIRKVIGTPSSNETACGTPPYVLGRRGMP